MYVFAYLLIGYISYCISSVVKWHCIETGEPEAESHILAFFGIISFWPIVLPQILITTWEKFNNKS